MSNERFKAWVFTWNNPGENDEPPNVWADVKYVIWQHERGESGTDHIQGYVIFTKRQTLKSLKETINDSIHWERRKGSHLQAKAYASKDDTRIDGPWEHGVEPKQGHRTDLDIATTTAVTQGMLAVAQDHPATFARYSKGLRALVSIMTPPRDWLTDLIVYWGPPNTGKSFHVRELWPDAFWLKRGRTGEPWWDGYEGQETVIIDEFYGWISVDTMSRLIDQFPYQVEVKGGSVQFLARRVVITSNQSLYEWWKTAYHGMVRRIEEGLVFHVTEPFYEYEEVLTDSDDQDTTQTELQWATLNPFHIMMDPDGQGVHRESFAIPEGFDVYDSWPWDTSEPWMEP